MSKCALCKTSLKDYEINVCDKCRLDFLNFEQQLAEKDKEIEYLRERNFYKVSLKDEECLGVYPKNMEKIIRHQVCDEIRAFFDVNPDTVEWDYLNEILNQVEGDVK